MRRQLVHFGLRSLRSVLTNDKTLVELIKPNHGERVKLDALSDDERATLARLMGKALGHAPQIEAVALPAPEPAPLLTERELLLAELAKHESPEEIARLRNEWPKE